MRETFKLIIEKIINTNNNIFSINYDSSDKVDKIIKMLFVTFLLKEVTPKNKLGFFFETIQNTFFKNSKEEFILHYCKIQHTYNGFRKLKQIFKYKTAKTVVNYDIGLNEINENQKNVISILQNNSKYLFSINDLLNIINTSLTNNYQFFAEPLCIKNPYSNLPFSKSTLYNIFYFILYKTYYRPDLFCKFFLCNFNLSRFGKIHEVLLREHAIKNFVYNSPSNVLVKEIKKMIKFFNNYYSHFNINHQININVDFPKQKLIKIMQPYLLVYFTSIFSMSLIKKREAAILFKRLMVKFYKFNPQFGRKKYKILFKNTKNFKKKIIGKLIEFDDRHIGFPNNHINNVDTFLKDHLLYEDSYNNINNLFIVEEETYFNDNNPDESYEEDDEADDEEAADDEYQEAADDEYQEAADDEYQEEEADEYQEEEQDSIS